MSRDEKAGRMKGREKSSPSFPHKVGYHRSFSLDYKIEALNAIKDFRYGDEVRDAVLAAKSDDEIANIMTNARMR